jgi:hypothetical protein
VKELRETLKVLWIPEIDLSRDEIADLLALLDDHERLRAASEANHLAKVEAYAELAEVMPLVEAAMDVVFIDGKPTSLHDGADKRLFDAVLALQKKGETK